MLTVFQNIVGPECLYIYVSNLTLYTLAPKDILFARYALCVVRMLPLPGWMTI